MNENFEKLNAALDDIESLLASLKSENDALKNETAELRGKLDDRELEILQLQENAEKAAAANEAEKTEIGECLEKLAERMNRLSCGGDVNNG